MFFWKWFWKTWWDFWFGPTAVEQHIARMIPPAEELPVEITAKTEAPIKKKRKYTKRKKKADKSLS